MRVRFANRTESLPAEQNNFTDKKAHPPSGLSLEKYRYPHLYTLQPEGDRYVYLEEIRRLSFAEWIEGKTDAVHLVPGYVMEIHSHPNPAVNTEIYEPESYGTSSTAIGPRWWIHGVTQEGEQPQVLGEFSPDRGFFYKANFIAIPSKTRFIPEAIHKKNRVIGDQTAIVTGPEGEEIYTDKYGRVKGQFHWDREGNFDEKTSCWVRVSQGWAGVNFGAMAIPRIGQEVVVSFLEGDPDRPLITGRVYNKDNMPPWELPTQKALSGIQSREIDGGQRNQLVMDDTSGEVQTQLSSDHELSQLNLGYMTRVNHIEGRKDFRGEGFELRTDGWGAIRAARGMYIGTEPRLNAENHHKDINESAFRLEDAVMQHEEQARLATSHNAQESSDGDEIIEELKKQSDEIKGSGEAHKELEAAHLLLSSPEGVAIGSSASLHLQSGKHTAITSGRHTSLVSGRSFFATALEQLSLFAARMGVKLFAGKGKVEIQAQSDNVEIIADQVMKLISAKQRIELAAAKEILLVAADSYIKISSTGIEQGTKGKWEAKAAAHSMTGPGGRTTPLPDLPEAAVQFNNQYQVIDELTHEPLANVKYELEREGGAIIRGVTDKNGMIPIQESLNPEMLNIRLLESEDDEGEEATESPDDGGNR